MYTFYQAFLEEVAYWDSLEEAYRGLLEEMAYLGFLEEMHQTARHGLLREIPYYGLLEASWGELKSLQMQAFYNGLEEKVCCGPREENLSGH